MYSDVERRIISPLKSPRAWDLTFAAAAGATAASPLRRVAGGG